MLPLLVCVLIQADQPVSKPPRRGEAMLAAARRAGARGGTLENPAHLQAFFSALEALAEGAATDHVRLAWFGNSLISSDNIVNVVRARLQTRFGDGGRGLLLTERIGDVGLRTRAGYAPKGGFSPFNLAMGPRGRGHFGLAGVFHESKRAASVEWQVEGEERAELFWLDHAEAPAMALLLDGTPSGEIPPEQSGTGASLALQLPPGTKRLSLRVAGAKAVVFGVSLERATPGIVLDTLGIPAAEAYKFLTADAETTAQQLWARHPELLVFMLGGNEIRRLGWSRVPAKLNKAGMRRDLIGLIDRTTGASGAACLVIGPIDAVFGPDALDESDKLKTRPHTLELVAMEREVAVERDCAYLDLFHAMGGDGSLGRFMARGWVSDDLVHPKGWGLDILGELIAQALLAAYDAQRPQPLARTP